MREGWTETTVGSLLSRSIGGVWGTEPGTDQEEVMVVRSTEFTKSGVLNFATGVPRSIKSGQLASRELVEGDILLEKSGGGPEQPVGRVVYVESDIPSRFVCSNFIQLLTPIAEAVLPRFLFLSMWMWHFQNKTLEYQAQTTGIRNLRTPDYLQQLILVPPIAEQRRIVDVVSSVDAYIDALQQQVDAARTARSAVLHELLSAGGDDWTETTLGELVSLRTGKLDVNAGVEDGEFPFFTCSRDTYKIDIAAYSGKSVIVAGNGDLNVKYYEGEFNAYQRTYILQATAESVLNPLFLFHFMDKYIETLRNDTQGSTIQYLKKAQFTEAPISLPPIAEQMRIVEIVSSMDDVIQAAEGAVVEAKNLRSGLLSDLLSGEHEIPVSYDELLGAA